MEEQESGAQPLPQEEEGVQAEGISEPAGSVDEVFDRLRAATTLKAQVDAVESWRVSEAADAGLHVRNRWLTRGPGAGRGRLRSVAGRPRGEHSGGAGGECPPRHERQGA